MLRELPDKAVKVSDTIQSVSTGERVKLNKKLTTLQAQNTHHLADQMISIDPDDGVEKNYAIFRMFWQK